MTTDTIHRTRSSDGTLIAGRVHGHGPPVVLVHGQGGDGDLDWAALLPHLTDRFTCHLPSTRCRGLSGDHADVSPERRVEDITAFVDSVGEQVAVVGQSDGGVLALGAAARSAAVTAVAAYEPPAPEALGGDEAHRLEEPVDEMARAVADGRMADAMVAFVDFVANDEERAALESSGYGDDIAEYAPVLLRELDAEQRPGAFSPTDPSVLREIAAPTLLLYGTRTPLRWFTDAVLHVAVNVRDAEVREIPGAGHAAPMLHPQKVADELVSFLG